MSKESAKSCRRLEERLLQVGGVLFQRGGAFVWLLERMKEERLLQVRGELGQEASWRGIGAFERGERERENREV